MGEVRLLTGMAVLHYDNLCIDPNQRRVYVCLLYTSDAADEL